MHRNVGLLLTLVLLTLLTWGGRDGSARAQDRQPTEYHRQGTVLALTRADMEFASDKYGDEPHDGTLLYSLGGILGGERTFWLLRDGLWEYDLEGNQLGVIPYSEPNKLGRLETLLTTAEGIYVLQNQGWNWSSDRPNETRLSYQLFSFADRKWLGPFRVPDVVEFAHSTAMIGLAVRDGEVLVIDAYKGLGVPISLGGRHCDPVVYDGVRDLESPKTRMDSATNGWGWSLVFRRAQDKGTIGSTEYFEYEIVNGARRGVGILRDYLPPPAERRPDREETPLLSWAILADATVLQLEISIYGEPDDAIRVIRWAP
jgi:hypothetical protein